MRIQLNFDLINVHNTQSLRMLDFANLTLGYENLISFYFYQV